MTVHRISIFGEAVDFVDCREVADGFASILRGWPISELVHDPARPAYVTFRREGDIYDWHAPWRKGRNRRLDDPSRSLMEAVCDFHYEFIDWYADRNPQHFCVHMAAVDFADGAVLFPAVQKAGKSTLSLHCVAAGHALIGDDVVALDGDAEGRAVEAIALGLLPRMRLPLHPSFSPPFVEFLQSHAGMSDRRWRYAALNAGQILPVGTRRPVAGIVILDRRPSGPARIEPAPASAALKALIDRNFGILEQPGRIFDTFHALVRQTECRRLTYSDVDEAVGMLREVFGGTPPAEPVLAGKEERHASA